MYTTCGHYAILLYTLHGVTMSSCEVHNMSSLWHPVMYTTCTCGHYVILLYILPPLIYYIWSLSSFDIHYMRSLYHLMMYTSTVLHVVTMSSCDVHYMCSLFIMWCTLYVVMVILLCTLHMITMLFCHVYFMWSQCHPVVHYMWSKCHPVIYKLHICYHVMYIWLCHTEKYAIVVTISSCDIHYMLSLLSCDVHYMRSLCHPVMYTTYHHYVMLWYIYTRPMVNMATSHQEIFYILRLIL